MATATFAIGAVALPASGAPRSSSPREPAAERATPAHPVRVVVGDEPHGDLILDIRSAGVRSTHGRSLVSFVTYRSWRRQDFAGCFSADFYWPSTHIDLSITRIPAPGAAKLRAVLIDHLSHTRTRVHVSRPSERRLAIPLRTSMLGPRGATAPWSLETWSSAAVGIGACKFDVVPDRAPNRGFVGR